MEYIIWWTTDLYQFIKKYKVFYRNQVPINKYTYYFIEFLLISSSKSLIFKNMSKMASALRAHDFYSPTTIRCIYICNNWTSITLIKRRPPTTRVKFCSSRIQWITASLIMENSQKMILLRFSNKIVYNYVSNI